MYRRIRLHPDEYIFWRASPSTPVQEYELRTLTFGLGPAPFLAQRVVKQLLADEGKDYPLAAIALNHHTYIDDVVTGANSIEEGLILQNQLKTLLAKGGFHLRKWSSNSPELLQTVPEEDLERPWEFNDGSQGLKVLGLYWSPQLDAFTYQVQPFQTNKITKRSISSFIARIFDPMGWLTPVIITAKRFLQNLWLQHLDWDAEVPEPLRSQWLTYCQQFEELKILKIPRNASMSNKEYKQPESPRYRLLGFCDASETAYAACIYLQNLDSETLQITLLQAKTKLAPLKSITLPCLELCGAVLLAKLVSALALPVPVQDTWLFTDSQIVLTWLRTPLYKLKNFVSNRIAQVLENSSTSQWSHISGSENPANAASRGLSPKDLIGPGMWWTGPQQIKFSEFSPTLNETTIPGLKSNIRTQVFLLKYSTKEVITFFESFSSWSRLQRVVAWILRFYHNSKMPNCRYKIEWLSVQEIRGATLRIISLVQSHYFASELHDLKEGHLPNSLKSLDLFLDSSDRLRVGGRLGNSLLKIQSKHPFLMPRDAHITTLIIRHFHEASLHSEPSMVQALIQREYWIPSLRSLVRKYTFQCIRCHLLRSQSVQPKMGDLPAERVTAFRPFSKTATDFAGPFFIKEGFKRQSRAAKCYLCIFVCLVVKAVHLELVTALTTQAFTRFISRRGLPTVVTSDKGKNFLGASRELKDLQRWLSENEGQIGSSLASRSIQWKFNPPNAPHFGGLFEAAIKSAKTLLYKMMGNQILTFEELTTLFSRIEAVLNSRPITHLSSDPSEDYLSPAHFLIGRVFNQLPEQPLEEPGLIGRWKRIQQLGQAFWRKWSTQYLQQIISRTKWHRNKACLRVGDLVYLKGQATSPLAWPMGRIIETFPGKDGVVRVVSVQTSSGTYVRPVNKLIPLPLGEQ